MALSGCGGGGSTTTTGVPIINNPKPGAPSTSSVVSGSVTDINGSAIVGATVTLGTQTATTSQGGTYSIPSVVVPAGQASLITGILATGTVNGKTWTGQNTVEVLNGAANTSNVNIVLSDSTAQASVSGTVKDTSGNPLALSRVFIAPGPASYSDGGLYFTNFSSFSVYTDSNGNYTVPKLPTGVTYTATASYTGHLNQTISSIGLTANRSGVNFALATSTSSPVLPAVNNFAVYGFTFPSVGTRAISGRAATVSAAGVTGVQAVKTWFLVAHGLTQSRFADASKIRTRGTTTRATPAGSLIESDLFWDYQAFNNLLGYTIVRSDGNNSNFFDIATLRDPLADRYDDVDAALTPGTSYYYNVGRLDTINFPQGNDSSSSGGATTIQVTPLGAIQISAPAPNATVASPPTFTWNAVPNAVNYQILVYSQFPAYQSNTTGVAPIWPANSSLPGTSLVTAPATQTTYAGPALQSGHTYYVVALAQYAPANNDPTIASVVSVSPIQAFTAQ